MYVTLYFVLCPVCCPYGYIYFWWTLVPSLYVFVSIFTFPAWTRLFEISCKNYFMNLLSWVFVHINWSELVCYCLKTCGFFDSDMWLSYHTCCCKLFLSLRGRSSYCFLLPSLPDMTLRVTLCHTIPYKCIIMTEI